MNISEHDREKKYAMVDDGEKRKLLSYSLAQAREAWTRQTIAIESRDRVLRIAVKGGLKAKKYNANASDAAKPNLETELAQLTHNRQLIETEIDVLTEELAALPPEESED